jgi:tight adherence protein B
MTKRVVLILAMVFAVVGPAASAQAATGAELTEAAGKRFPLKAFVLTLPRQKVLTVADVQVRENGQDVEGLTVTPGGAAGATTFGAILVIDTSLSMRGTPIQQAMAAARQFAAHRPAQQRLGVVFFNHTPSLVLRPTTNAAQINSVLASTPTLSRGTRIYDAAAVALRELAKDHVSVGSLVLLSDGADNGSTVPTTAVAGLARKMRTRVFTVGLRSKSYDGTTLLGLANDTGGRYAESTGKRLEAIFAALGRRLGREYLVTYKSLVPLGARVSVTTTVNGVPGTASATYVAPAFRPPSGSAPRSHPHVAASSGNLVIALLAALLVGLGVLVLVRPVRRTVQSRISDFTASPGDLAVDDVLEAVEGPRASRRGRQRRPSARWASFSQDVDVGGMRSSPEKIAIYTVIGTAVAMLAAIAIGNRYLAFMLLPSPVLMRMFVASRASRQRREFEAQLADNLQIVASAMRSGQSFVGALSVAVEDAAEPARRELHRAITDERLGVPLDEALGRAAERMRSEELGYVGLVATLQRDTGGNTAEVLDRITETIRGRAELNRMIRTLTAQGRLGGGIVTGLPIALAAFFVVTKPSYFKPLVSTSFGWVLITAGVLMLVAGWLVIRKIVDIKV